MDIQRRPVSANENQKHKNERGYNFGMHRLKRGWIVILCFLVVCSGLITVPLPSKAEDAAYPSSLANAGFEEPLVDGEIPGWSSMGSDTGDNYYFEVSSEQAASGNNSLKIVDESGGSGAKSVAVISDPVAVVPGDNYTVTAQVYMLEREVNSTASLKLNFYDASGNVVSYVEQHHETGKGFPVEQWAEASTPQAVAPEDASYARVILFTTAYSTAIAYFDDVELKHEPAVESPEKEEPGLLANAGFEEPLVDGEIPGWSSFFATTGKEYYYEVTDELSYSGKYSLKIVDLLRNQSVAVISDPVEVTPGEVYAGTAYMYLEANSVASLNLRFYDEEGRQLSEHAIHNETSKGFPVGQFTRVTTPSAAAPENAKYARLIAYTTSYAIATAYYDDMNIVHVIQGPEIGTELSNPGFEEPVSNDGIPGWESVFATTGEDFYYVVSDEQSASGNYSLKIVDRRRDQSVALLSNPVAVVPGDYYTGAGKMYIDGDGVGSISIRFYDKNGAQLDVGSPEIHYEPGKAGFRAGVWTDVVTNEVKAPDDAAYARLLIYTTSYAMSEVYYDDLSIIHIPDLTPAKLNISAPSALSPGQEFTVTLNASDLKELYKLDAMLHYDKLLLKYSGIEAAGAFAAEGASLAAEPSDGKVRIIAQVNPETPLTADSDIAHIHFRVIGDVGQAWIVLSRKSTLNDVHMPPSDLTVLFNVGETGEGLLANRVFGEIEDMGAPIADSIGVFDGAAGVEDGRNVMYTTVKGIPPMFHVIDLDNNKLLRSIPLEGGGDVWAHEVATDGTVYIAAGGQLWAYSPETKQAEMVLTYPGESVFWALADDEEGNIYIATGPGGKILKYDPETGEVRDYGRLMGHISQEYVRSIAYSNGYVYGGTSLAEIYKVDVETGEKEEIASPLNEEGYVYDLDIVDDRWLIARFDTSQKRYIYDLEAEKWLDVVIENSVSGLHLTETSLDGKIYMPVNGTIMMLDLNTFELEPSGMEYNTAFRGADWIEMTNDPDLPGKSIVTMNFSGDIYFFNPQTKTVKKYDNVMPPSPSITHKFQTGENGKIYVTAMQASKASEYDVFTGENKLFPMGQAGSITPYEGNVYFGVYPGGEIYLYDPASGEDPKMLLSIGDEQDRPITSVVGDDGKIYIGSIPDYGELGGALTVIDPHAEESGQRVKVFRNIVENQSVISLAYKDGKIYGSTNINGGLSSETTATEAKIFVWDTVTEEKIAEISLDIPGLYKPASIGGLSIGPDGLLWGGVNGIVFAMDPESLAVIKYKNLFPNDSGWGQWGSFHAQWSDGLLYMHLGRRLVVIDPLTLDYHYFGDSEAFAIGADGHLYFSPHETVRDGANRTLMYRIQVRNTGHPGKLNLHAPLHVRQGEDFEVTLHLNQTVNLQQFTAHVTYDPETLAFVSAEAAGPLANEGAQLTVTNTSGALAISGALAEGDSLYTDAQVAVLRFKAIQDAKATPITLLAESEVAFANSDETVEMNQDRTITVRITAASSEDPADPVDPADPDDSDDSSDSADAKKPAKTEDSAARDEIMQISEEQLRAEAEGGIEVAIKDGNRVVRLPVNAAEIIGDRSFTLSHEQFSLVISPEVLLQLGQLLPDQERNGANIEISFDLLAQEDRQAIADAASNKYHADIVASGGGLILGISVMTQDGTSVPATVLDNPVQLRIPLDEQANRDLVGIYAVEEDGTLTYVSGKQEGNWLVAEVKELKPYLVLEYTKVFHDVPEDHWASDAIQKLAAMQIVQGVSPSEFAPDQPVTRAEFAALMVRLLGYEPAGSSYFEDVRPDDWFAPYVDGAYELGVVTGKSSGRFEPNQWITREETAAIAVRIYEYLAGEIAEGHGAGFADQNKISSWAVEFVNKAYRLGLFQGQEDQLFHPAGMLTRAEAAQVVVNLLNMLNILQK